MLGSLMGDETSATGGTERLAEEHMCKKGFVEWHTYLIAAKGVHLTLIVFFFLELFCSLS